MPQGAGRFINLRQFDRWTGSGRNSALHPAISANAVAYVIARPTPDFQYGVGGLIML
jgi:hypothetical protein